MQKSILILALAAIPCSALLSGCIVAAVGTGVVAGEVMFEDNTYIGHINADAGRAWTQTKTTLAKKSAKPVDVDEAHRKIVADLDGTTVTAAVETYDMNVSVLRVSAKKYGFADNEMAKLMFDRITEDIYRGR